jgi:hypothetical protein
MGEPPSLEGAAYTTFIKVPLVTLKSETGADVGVAGTAATTTGVEKLVN